MSERDVEIEAARLLLEQDESAAESPVADAAVRAAMEQMAQTAAALRAWRKSHESMPAPVIAPDASRDSGWHGDVVCRHAVSANAGHGDKQRRHATLIRRFASKGSVAAAAAVIVVGLAVGLLSRGSWGDSNRLAADLAWAGKTAPVAPADQSARMEFDTQGKGFGSEGAVGGAPAPGNMIGRPADSDGGPPGDSQPPELDAFVRQFAFAFRIPQQLPGGWEFERGRPISESRVQLIYRRGDQTLSVFVSPAGGGDLEFRGVQIGGRKMSTGRRGGLAIAFEGGQAEAKIWNDVARELRAKEDSPQRTQRTQR
jgi:hypothetical protein